MARRNRKEGVGVAASGEIEGDFGVAMVLLRHEGSSAGDHFDWMIQRGVGADAPLRSWRVMVDMGMLRVGDWLIGEETPEHRAAYLTLEGEVSGGRGRVKRVRRGRARVREDAAIVEIELRWEDGTRHAVRGERVEGLERMWRFEVVG